MLRLQKFLADAGVASRRASEKIILEGRVAVNGAIVRELGSKIDPARDRVAVDGRPLKARRKLYVAINKPRGFICTRHDEADRDLIGDLLPREWGNLFSVGRLDRDSEGLIFMTNDGEFALKLTHPRFGVRKTYVATLEGRVEPGAVQSLTRGVEHDGEKLKAERVRLVSSNNTTSVVELELAEGKNREVRRMFEALGSTVARLQRIKIGPIRLGELRVGKWRTLTESEIKSLLGGL